MNAWEFMAERPVLTWFLAWPVLFVALTIIAVVGQLLLMPFNAWSRFLRHRNVKTAGWPPAHLDADGDWKPAPKTAG